MGNRIHRMVVTSFFFLVLGMLASCRSDKDEIRTGDGDAMLQINTVTIAGDFTLENELGIPDDENPSSGNTNPESQTVLSAGNREVLRIDRGMIHESAWYPEATEEHTGAIREEMQHLGDFDALVGMRDSRAQRPDVVDSTATGLRASIDPGRVGEILAEPVAMTGGIRFRLVIINDQTSQVVINQEVVVGVNPNIAIDAGFPYRWYAFSTNESTSVPSVNVTTGIVSRGDLHHKDLLHAEGTLNAEYGDNYLNIIFQRQTKLIEVDLNTRGLFGSIANNASISLGSLSGTTFTNIVRIGDFNIFTKAFTNLQDVTAVSGSTMTVINPVYGNAMKRAYFYTVRTAPIPTSTLALRLNSLNIILDDNNTTRTFPATNVPIPHTGALALTTGTRSRATVRLIESGVLAGGARWARTNLVYDATKPDPYRFRANNNYAVANPNEYWNFGAVTPTGPLTTDVCRERVYPIGTWQIASPQNYNSLNAVTVTRTTTSVPDGTRYSYEYNWAAAQTASSAYPDDANRRLIFSLYGYRNPNGSYTQRPHEQGSGFGQAHYYTNNHVIAESRPVFVHGRRSSTNGWNAGTGANDARLVEQNFEGAATYNQGRNIRCMRLVVN